MIDYINMFVLIALIDYNVSDNTIVAGGGVAVIVIVIICLAAIVNEMQLKK